MTLISNDKEKYDLSFGILYKDAQRRLSKEAITTWPLITNRAQSVRFVIRG